MNETTCEYEGCENGARYISEHGLFCCGTCPVQHRHDAIKLASVSELLKLVRVFLHWDASPFALDGVEHWAKKFREIVGVDASTRKVEKLIIEKMPEEEVS